MRRTLIERARGAAAIMQNSPNQGLRNLLTELADEIESLHNRLAGAAEIAEGHRLLIAEGEKQASEGGQQ